MPDRLVPLYQIPDPAPFVWRCEAAGITVRRIEAWDGPRLDAFISENFNEAWAAEAAFALTGGHPISGYLAIHEGLIAGLAVYESSRRDFFGPTGVREDLRGTGAGAVLLLRSLESMREMGYGYAIIGWVGPAEFYAKVCGATIIPGSDPGLYAAYQQEQAARSQNGPA